MFAVKGGGDLTTGAGGREEARGGRSGREGADGGEEGTVDGASEGARMGKEGQMPHGAIIFPMIQFAFASLHRTDLFCFIAS